MNKIDFLKGLSGRRITLTNKISNGNFASTSGWIGQGTVASNEAYMTATSQYHGYAQTISTISGHKYYFCGWLYSSSNQVCEYLNDTGGQGLSYQSGTGAYEFISSIYTAGTTTSSALFGAYQDRRASGWTLTKAKYVSVIDLTAAFGAGLEPTKAQMDGLMATLANNWLDGTQTVPITW